jgi:outer membrane protein
MDVRILYLITASALLMGTVSIPAEPLTLEDCVVLARQRSLGVAQATADIEKARAGLTGARSLYYPSVDLSTGYRNQEGLPGERAGHYSSSVSVQYPIFRGGYIPANTRIAEIGVQMAEEQYRLAENDVVLSVQEAFFDILLQQDQTALVERVLERREEDLAIIRLKYEAGRESWAAVQEAEASLFQAEYRRMKAEKEQSLAKARLNLLLDRPSTQEMTLEYEDEIVQYPPLDSLIEEARDDRPEITIRRANAEAVRAQLRQARSHYWPTVSLSASYAWQGEAFLEQESDWSAGMNVSLPLFTGFSRRADVAQATLSLQKEELSLRELLNTVEEEAELAYANWELAVVNREVSERSLEAVQEMYRLTKLQYEEGRTSYLFLQQKETALTQAELDYASALFDLRVARARLENAWGRRN